MRKEWWGAIEEWERAWMKRDRSVHEWTAVGGVIGGAGEAMVGGKWWMSRAWPLFQVHLWGAFDHATDLNDRQVIQRGEQGFKEGCEGKIITQVVVVVGAGGNGKCGRWVREWGEDMDRTGYGQIVEKKNRVNGDISCWFSPLFLWVCFSSLNGCETNVCIINKNSERRTGKQPA